MFEFNSVERYTKPMTSGNLARGLYSIAVLLFYCFQSKCVDAQELPDISVLLSKEVPITMASGSVVNGAASDGTNFFVQCNNSSSVIISTITPSGAIQSLELPVSMASADFCSSRQNQFIPWSNHTKVSGAVINSGAFIQTNLTIYDSSTNSSSYSVDGFDAISCASDGTNWLVTSWSSEGIVGFLVSSNFTCDQLFKISESNQAAYPSITFNGENYFCAWQQVSGGGGISAARISVTGTVIDRTNIVISSGPASLPRVASDGHNFLAVWREIGKAVFQAALIGGDGQVLKTNPIPLALTYDFRLPICCANNMYVLSSFSIDDYDVKLKGMVLNTNADPVAAFSCTNWTGDHAICANDAGKVMLVSHGKGRFLDTQLISSVTNVSSFLL